jgi:hypothetical protein
VTGLWTHISDHLEKNHTKKGVFRNELFSGHSFWRGNPPPNCKEGAASFYTKTPSKKKQKKAIPIQ